MPKTITTAQAQAALQAHAWREAYEGFAGLDAAGALDAAELEALAQAAWWSALPAESLAAFERAYAAHVAEANARRAAFVAPQYVDYLLEHL